MQKKLKRLSERRAITLKSEILEAAIKVFCEYGYKGFTTRKIAETAGIAEGTIYNHFKDKNDLLITLVKDYIDQIRKKIYDIKIENGDNSGESLVKIIRDHLYQFEKLPFFTLILHEIRFDPKIRDNFTKELFKPIPNEVEELIQGLIEKKIVRPINPKIFSLFMSALILGFAILVETENEDYKRFSPEKVSIDVVDIILNGIKSKKEMK